MPLKPLNHHYAIENPASVYDEEAMTALELAGRTTAKVNETVDAFNQLESNTNRHLVTQDQTIERRMNDQDHRLDIMEIKQIPETVTAEMQERIDGGEFDNAIDKYAGNLSDRVDNLLGQVTEGSTSGDAELIDARTSELGLAHANAGNAIRRNGTNIAKLKSMLIDTGAQPIDPTTFSVGYVNQTNGNVTVNENHKVCDFFEVKGGTQYTPACFKKITYSASLTKDLRIVFYDIDKKYITGTHFATVESYTVTSPENAVYCRCSMPYGTTYTIQIFEGEVTNPTYTPYYHKIKEDILPARGSYVEETFDPTINLANPANHIPSCFVNQVNGGLHTSSSNSAYHHTYHMLKAEPDKVYTVGCYYKGEYTQNNTTVRIVFYDENGTYLSGTLDELTATAPLLTAFVSVSLNYAYDLMLVEGDTLPEFEKFKGYINPGYINAYTRDEVDALLATNSVVINLPDKVYALVGQELNIYFDNLVPGHDKDYTFNVDCAVGNQLERCYRVTPTTANVGTHSLTVNVTRNGVTTSKATTLVIAPTTAGSGVTRSVIILGDSTTANGIVVSKLQENFSGDLMNVTNLGTNGTGANKHEGRSGWKYDMYFNTQSTDSNQNPFYNPETQTFDAYYYFLNTGVAVPDYFIINLGINDVFASASESKLNEINEQSDAMIASIRSACPNTKICVALTIPPNYSQDAFGKAYGCEQTRDGYKQNNHTYVQNLIARYGGREDEGIYLIPIHTNLDTKYNMGMEEIPVNKRNSKTYSSPVANGGVHPDTNGYWQIADAYWFFIKCMEV